MGNKQDCELKGCDNRTTNLYCKEHTCNKFTCTNLSISHKYCNNHECAYEDCTNLRGRYEYCSKHSCIVQYQNGHCHGSHNCPVHMCAGSSCQRRKCAYNARYCLNHICKVKTCKNQRLNGLDICITHKCTINDCNKTSYRLLSPNNLCDYHYELQRK